jgi:imidazolonepropionase-like amidohydrolase
LEGRRRFKTQAIALTLILTGSPAISYQARAQDKTPASVAFVHVSVLPMKDETVLQDQTVLVENGRIAQVGVYSQVRTPAGALLIDGKGKYLIPGLCDMHVHVHYQEELLPYLANGFTTILNMRGAPFHLLWREQLKTGKMIGPTLYTAGPTLNGLPRLHRLNRIVLTPEDAIAAVNSQQAEGYDYIKVYNNIPTAAYDAILEAAKAKHIGVVGHWVRSAGPDLLAKGQVNIAHVEEFYYGYFDSQPNASVLDKAAEAAQSNGVTVTTTLVAIRNISKLPAGIEPFLRLPETKFVPPPVLEDWKDNPFKDLKADFVEKNDTMYLFLKKITKALQNHNARVMLGTDADFETLVGGFASQDELDLLVESGLTPYQALVAATRTPGEFVAQTLGSQEQFGTIEAGKRADMVLLDANPIQDIAATRRRTGVMARGVWYTQSDLNEMMEDVAASFIGWR